MQTRVWVAAGSSYLQTIFWLLCTTLTITSNICWAIVESILLSMVSCNFHVKPLFGDWAPHLYINSSLIVFLFESHTLPTPQFVVFMCFSCQINDELSNKCDFYFYQCHPAIYILPLVCHYQMAFHTSELSYFRLWQSQVWLNTIFTWIAWL